MRMLKKTIASDYFIFLLILIYLAAVFPINPIILSPYNFSEIFSNLWPLFIIASGQMIVMIAAGIDLSQISVISLSSILIGLLLTTEIIDLSVVEKYPVWGMFLAENGGFLSSGGLHTFVAILLVLFLCTGVGLINGLSVAYLKMPPFMVTLITQMFFSALALYLTRSDSISYLNEGFYYVSEVELLNFGAFSFRGNFLVGVIVALFLFYLLKFTLYGRRLFAIGINVKAAKISGVRVNQVIVIAYALSSFLAAVGGILYSSRLEIGRPSLGNFSMLMDVIGANVIAGVSLFGGRGKVAWVLLGAMFFVILSNSLNVMRVEFYVNDVIKGLVIAFAASLDVYRMKYLSRN